jgi:hypothetical protein
MHMRNAQPHLPEGAWVKALHPLMVLFVAVMLPPAAQPLKAFHFVRLHIQCVQSSRTCQKALGSKPSTPGNCPTGADAATAPAMMWG